MFVEIVGGLAVAWCFLENLGGEGVAGKGLLAIFRIFDRTKKWCPISKWCIQNMCVFFNGPTHVYRYIHIFLSLYIT